MICSMLNANCLADGNGIIDDSTSYKETMKENESGWENGWSCSFPSSISGFLPSQKHEGTILGGSNFLLLRSVRMFHSRGCEPQPGQSTCAMDSIHQILILTILREEMNCVSQIP
ncbi:uncharacterized protein LOC111314041 [Durio zibethinus]|uniref:Uncharacterized protein LOC111314041 n=1 Tax=Durio zibethinus TaxID=66656 RepID=A0A6P6B177_DURZI|nr:uncharacterized protein LOC111314041 [Durio zibethinus]